MKLIEQLSLSFEDDHYDLGGGDYKLCSKCNKKLSLSAFSRTSGGNYLRPECKKCNNELRKIRAKLNEQYGMPKENYV